MEKHKKNMKKFVANMVSKNNTWFNPTESLKKEMIEYFLYVNDSEVILDFVQAFNKVYGEDSVLAWNSEGQGLQFSVGKRYQLLFLEFLLRQRKVRHFSFEDLQFKKPNKPDKNGLPF